MKLSQPTMETLALETCGCQLPWFTCVVCNSTFTVGMTTKFGCPLLYHSSELYHFYISSLDITYNKFEKCVTDSEMSESSITCPKVVFELNDLLNFGVICGSCRHDTINELAVYRKVTPALQNFLELSLKS